MGICGVSEIPIANTRLNFFSGRIAFGDVRNAVEGRNFDEFSILIAAMKALIEPDNMAYVWWSQDS